MKNDYAFFAMTDRSRYIQRWSLMRNTQDENVAEHSFQTAVIAHGLAVIRRAFFPEAPCAPDPDKVLAAAVFHDVSEVITGDLPTPVKYHDPDLKNAYKRIEQLACEDLLGMLPEKMRAYYEPLIAADENGRRTEEEKSIQELVKAADKLSAYLKCYGETAQGNREFKDAQESTLARLRAMEMPEVDFFLEHFAPPFALSLDELRRRNGTEGTEETKTAEESTKEP